MNSIARWVGIIGVSLALNAPAQGERLPSLGEAQVWSTSQEQRLGASIKASLYASDRVWTDPVLEDYVRRVWGVLFESARTQGLLPDDLAESLPWVQLVIRDASLNAFAMPGGVVGVHLGLLASGREVDTLAAVLAHEMSHVSQRHIPRLLEAQNQVTPLAMGALLVAILIAGQNDNADAAQAAIAGSQAVVAQAGINFTRGMEQEADRVGWQIYTGAGFSSQGYAALFEKLEQASRLNDDGSHAYLRTHPLSRERIAEVMARQTFQSVSSPAGHPDLIALAPWVQMRAKVAATTRADDWRAWVSQAGPLKRSMSADEQRMLYLAMHSAIRLGDFEWAWKAIQHLVQLPQESAAVEALLSADWLSIARQLPQPSVREHEAQARIQRGLKSGWRGEWLAAVRWSIERGQADQVVGALQSKVVTDPLDYEMWTMLALAREAQGETLRMLRAQAEAQWARGNASGAVDRIVAARVWSVAHPAIDPIEAQVVLTRERDMRRFMAAQAAAEAADR